MCRVVVVAGVVGRGRIGRWMEFQIGTALPERCVFLACIHHFALPTTVAMALDLLSRSGCGHVVEYDVQDPTLAPKHNHKSHHAPSHRWKSYDDAILRTTKRQHLSYC